MLPARPRSTGLAPVCEPPFRLYVTGIGDRPRPVDLASGVQLGQQQLVQPLPDAGLLPQAQEALQGILFVLHTGMAWRHRPKELGFGCGMTAWRRSVFQPLI